MSSYPTIGYRNGQRTDSGVRFQNPPNHPITVIDEAGNLVESSKTPVRFTIRPPHTNDGQTVRMRIKYYPAGNPGVPLDNAPFGRKDWGFLHGPGAGVEYVGWMARILSRFDWSKMPWLMRSRPYISRYCGTNGGIAGRSYGGCGATASFPTPLPPPPSVTALSYGILKPLPMVVPGRYDYEQVGWFQKANGQVIPQAAPYGPWKPKEYARFPWEHVKKPNPAQNAGAWRPGDPGTPAPEPPPWRVIPKIKPNPWRSPREQSLRGYHTWQMFDWGQQTGTQPPLKPPPKPIPTIPPRPHGKPGPGVKERKVKLMGFGGNWFVKAWGSLTEGLDALDAIWRSLPCALRARLMKESGGFMTPQEKMAAIYRHFGEVDMEKAVYNLLIDNLTDKYIGKINQAVQAQRHLQFAQGYGSGAGYAWSTSHGKIQKFVAESREQLAKLGLVKKELSKC